MRRWWILLILSCSLARLAGAAESHATWISFAWNGERALRSESSGWLAIVSLERGRLMHFGPAAGGTNLLLAPVSRDNRNRLGGHRLWLGPQATWTKIWPPPDAWEYREAEMISFDGGILRLRMPDAGEGWPRLTRTYHWTGGTLVCGAELSGGTRPAQFVHILQVSALMTVAVESHPEGGFPAGYVMLPSTAGPFATHFTEPPQVARVNQALTLRQTGAVVKLGFRPQTLTGRLDGFELRVSRGAQTGVIAGDPDAGFHTQVYLSGGHEAFAELEQLSPLFRPGQPARFEMALTGVAP